jgi:hypothetical protein
MIRNFKGFVFASMPRPMLFPRLGSDLRFPPV